MLEIKQFDQRLKSIPDSIWQKITKIDHLQGQWIAGAKLSPQALGRLKRSVLITSTGASTRIEGAKLSDEDIEKLMSGLAVQKFADRDSQEARGYYELLEHVFDGWKNLPFSENNIKHFHKELLKYATKDEAHRGDYKKQENRVQMLDASGQSVAVLFDTTPAYLTPKETQELAAWTADALKTKAYHPLLTIGHFVVSFLKIHPFQDGNGRLSRILTNLLLLQAGYEYMPYVSHEKLIEDNKPAYYVALRKSQKTFGANQESITPWLDFFLDIILKQSAMALDLLSKENIEKLLTKKQLAVWEYLQKVDGAAPGEIAQATAVAQPTVRQALTKLLKLKKVERLGQGRSTNYRIIKK
ncbi:MAG: Fic family protein [Parcubacteria group bacterium]|nr:Fic family protein [Parcubacteria group bacterium]